MRNVVWSMLPIAGFAVWQYGLSVLALLLTVTLSCLLSERLFNRLSRQPSTLGVSPNVEMNLDFQQATNNVRLNVRSV